MYSQITSHRETDTEIELTIINTFLPHTNTTLELEKIKKAPSQKTKTFFQSSAVTQTLLNNLSEAPNNAEQLVLSSMTTNHTPSAQSQQPKCFSVTPCYVGRAVVMLLLLPFPLRFGSPILDARASTSGDISQLPLFLPQLERLG